jgi:aryl-alcohol dehydrogenase-like predicted oxidoreductase
VAAAREMLAAAMDAGVNFFDNAEVYALGKSETVMGEAIKALNWPRLNYVVSTKFYWGLSRDGNTVNRKDTLNRKYLMQAIDGSLQRMGLDFIDLVYCHRPDPHTPIEETVWAMSDMISQGKALYWAPASGRPAISARRGMWPSATTCTNPSWSNRSTTCSAANASRWNTRIYTMTLAWA